MYYSHFGLDQAPFKITPNTEFFFNGGNRGAILEALIYTITHGEGIVKVTGEVGSGKTMLCNMLQTRLPPNIETVYLAHPSVLPEEILHAIAFELQLGIERGAPRIEVMHRLQDYLLARHAEGKRVVMFVEESQSMPLATLEEIRLLSNLETRNDKLLQIVLFGQPELDENLRRPSIRQLKERITHSFQLGPLNAAETREYLMFRLRAAGYRGPDLFSSAVIKFVVRASRGLTRRINLIADKALLAAFSENTHTVKVKHVKEAVRDSEFGGHRQPDREPRFARGLALVVTGAAAGALAYALIADGGSKNFGANRSHPPGTAATPSAPPVKVGAASASLGNNALQSMNQPVTESISPRAASGQVSALSIPVQALPAPAGTAASIVDQRLAASRVWLTDAAPTTYSIQLMGIEAEDQLKRHLSDIGKFVELDKVFLYRTIANRKASLTVLYGSFSDRRAAQDALEKLPSALKGYRPILRTMRGIRTEIMRHQSS
jgi:type II secretory pathway predicted ATPase ExeA